MDKANNTEARDEGLAINAREHLGAQNRTASAEKPSLQWNISGQFYTAKPAAVIPRCEHDASDRAFAEQGNDGQLRQDACVASPGPESASKVCPPNTRSIRWSLAFRWVTYPTFSFCPSFLPFFFFFGFSSASLKTVSTC